MNNLHFSSQSYIALTEAELELGVENESDLPIYHPKPTNRALVSTALRLLARRDMSRVEFVSKLRKLSSAKSTNSSRSPIPSAVQPPESNPSPNPTSKNLFDADVTLTTGRTNSNRVGNCLSHRAAKIKQHDMDNEAEFSADEIEAVADWCAAEGFLNEARFAEGKARSLAGRYGAKRVGATLKQKGVTGDIVAETVSALRETDLSRARAMWLRKFAEPAVTINDRNKQVRYLQSRGFGFDVIKRVINGASDEEES